jgi:hypothetical protein
MDLFLWSRPVTELCSQEMACFMSFLNSDRVWEMQVIGLGRESFVRARWKREPLLCCYSCHLLKSKHKLDVVKNCNL